LRYVAIVSNGLILFCLFNLVLDGVDSVTAYLNRPRWHLPAYLQPAAKHVVDREQAAQAAIQIRLYGWAGRSTKFMQLVAGGSGILLCLLIFPTMSIIAPLGGVLYFLPIFLANQHRQRARWNYLSQVRHLIDHLRLASDLNQSLTWGLRDAVASTPPGRYLVFDRLRYHLHRQGALAGPLVALQQVSREFGLRELEDLTDRLDSAQDGDEYVLRNTLQEAAEDIGQEIARQLQMHIEEAPVRLLFPIMAGLFPPILLLVFYPTMTILMAGIMY